MEKDGLPGDQNPITDAPPTFQKKQAKNKTFNYGSCSNNKAKNDIPFNNSFEKIMGQNIKGNVWNCRGAKTAVTIKETKQFCREHQPNFFIFLRNQI